MRFFATWWDRMPVRHIGAALAVVAIVVMVGAQFSVPRGGPAAPKIHLNNGPQGEVWT